MTFADTRPLLEKIFSARGEITGALGDAPFPLETARKLGAEIACSEKIIPEKSVFENVSAPLAAAGMPWEAARERIGRELRFWFGKFGDEEHISALAAGTLPRELRARLPLARAIAAKDPDAPLVLTETLPEISPEIFAMLKARAREDGFAVALERTRREELSAADFLAFFPEENENASPALCTLREAESAPESLFVSRSLRACRFGTDAAPLVLSGTTVGAGAGEFLADVAGTQIHGKLCGNAPDDDVPEGTPIDVFLPPEIFRLDAFPPEENFFALADGGEILSGGALFHRSFRRADGAGTLTVAALHRQSLEIPEGASFFAWFFPEDALGFPKKAVPISRERQIEI